MQDYPGHWTTLDLRPRARRRRDLRFALSLGAAVFIIGAIIASVAARVLT